MFKCWQRCVHQLHLLLVGLSHPSEKEGAEVFRSWCKNNLSREKGVSQNLRFLNMSQTLSYLMCRYSVLFNNKDHVAVLIADVEATQVLAEVVDVVHLADQGRCRERLLARHRQRLLLLLCQISLPKVQAQLSTQLIYPQTSRGFSIFQTLASLPPLFTALTSAHKLDSAHPPQPARAAALSHNLTHIEFWSGIHKFCQHSVNSWTGVSKSSKKGVFFIKAHIWGLSFL